MRCPTCSKKVPNLAPEVMAELLARHVRKQHPPPEPIAAPPRKPKRAAPKKKKAKC